MPRKSKIKHGSGWLIWLVPLALIDLILLMFYLTKDKNVALFNPKGHVAQEQFELTMFALAVLFAVTIPVMFLLYFVAWKYRESNTKATHDPNQKNSKMTVALMWIVPVLCLFIMAPVMWFATHRLEPIKELKADNDTMKIQVVAMQWKWVFLYPEHNIATVNFVQIPKDTPVTFELTADESPMSSFWIPNLGGQLYAMTGHVNKLNLIGDTVGDFPGSTAELTGSGFSGMRFTARVSTTPDFENWVFESKQSGSALDESAYSKLLEPSKNNPHAVFASYQPGLYDKITSKYLGSHGGHATSDNNSNEGGH